MNITKEQVNSLLEGKKYVTKNEIFYTLITENLGLGCFVPRTQIIDHAKELGFELVSFPTGRYYYDCFVDTSRYKRKFTPAKLNPDHRIVYEKLEEIKKYAMQLYAESPNKHFKLKDVCYMSGLPTISSSILMFAAEVLKMSGFEKASASSFSDLHNTWTLKATE